MTPLALRLAAPRERRQPAATARSPARCGGRSSATCRPTTCRSRTSRTASTCRRSSRRRCARCSTATSATAGSRARPTRRPGSRSTRSRTTSCGRRATRRARQLVDYVTHEERAGPPAARRGPGLRQGASRESFDPDTLTLGFARRIATYKRLFLLDARPRARAAGSSRTAPPLQMVVAGKAHPHDENAKQMLERRLRAARTRSGSPSRVAFLEDYDLSVAAPIVGGCDVWINVPRPPLEASGTSGMKAAVNGGLNLSVLDGWWAEGYDGDERLGDRRRRGRRGRGRAGRAPRGGALRPARARGDPALLRPRRGRRPAALARAGEGVAPDERPRASRAARMVEEYAASIYPR